MILQQDIPMIGLGTYKLKTRDEIMNSMEHAIKTGYRMFDTAELYKNEQLISDFIENNLPDYNLSRNDIWITTKIPYFTMLEGNERKIRDVIENSIRLFKGYVDLFLIHASNPNDVMVWYLLREYQKSGKIRNVGISNYNVERVAMFCDAIGLDETRMIYANQVELNPFLTRNGLVEKCQRIGIRVIAYGSLYKSNDYILELAKKYSRTPEQILLQWASKQGVVVIPMSRNSEHIKDNYNALCDVNLTDDDMWNLNNFDEGYTRYRKHL